MEGSCRTDKWQTIFCVVIWWSHLISLVAPGMTMSQSGEPSTGFIKDYRFISWFNESLHIFFCMQNFKRGLLVLKWHDMAHRRQNISCTKLPLIFELYGMLVVYNLYSFSGTNSICQQLLRIPVYNHQLEATKLLVGTNQMFYVSHQCSGLTIPYRLRSVTTTVRLWHAVTTDHIVYNRASEHILMQMHRKFVRNAAFGQILISGPCGHWAKLNYEVSMHNK